MRGAVSNDRPYRDSQRLSLELSLPVGQQPGCRDPLKRGRIGALTQVSYSPKPLEAALEALPVANAAHILCDSLTPSPLVNCRGSRTATQAANALRRGLADRRAATDQGLADMGPRRGASINKVVQELSRSGIVGLRQRLPTLHRAAGGS